MNRASAIGASLGIVQGLGKQTHIEEFHSIGGICNGTLALVGLATFNRRKISSDSLLGSA